MKEQLYAANEMHEVKATIAALMGVMNSQIQDSGQYHVVEMQLDKLFSIFERNFAHMSESFSDSYNGKYWSTAVQKCFEAPFVEVAVQYLLMRVVKKTEIETLEKVLSKKWEAYNEKEAISPMNIVSVAHAENMDVPSGATIRNLRYVKVWDIEKMLEDLKESN